MVSAFKKISSHHVETLGIELEIYQHNRLGTRHCHLACSDTNNTFWVGLSTVPTDSTGVAHILEHLSLCGSEKYPVRDPFFMMYRRSMAEMNAMTSEDWTAYYFSTPNKKDFENLLSVYLDAVFFPSLDPLDFKQEGWRLEFENPDDISTDLCYRGVVYNEMKGALSSPTSRLHGVLSSTLFPTTTYRFESGGDPIDIPKLTYEQLKDFHREHYHPSNATFYTYGHIPASTHQVHFEAQVLKRFEQKQSPIRVPKELTFSQSVDSHQTYAVSSKSDEEDATFHVMSWVLGDVTDFHLRLSMILMSSVLIRNSACRLLNTIETSQLGSAPYCHFVDFCGRQMTFYCGVKGSQPEKRASFERLVTETLEDIVKQGIDRDLIETTLHQMELGQRHISSNQGKYIIQMLNGSAVHGADLNEIVDIDAGLIWLRQASKKPRFIEDLIQKYLLDNKHKVFMTYQPSHDHFVSDHKHLVKELSTIKAGLSDQQKQHLVDQARSLKERQEKTPDESVLPKLLLSDVIKSDARDYDVFTKQYHGYPIYQCAANTNGLFHLDWMFTVADLSEQEMQLLPIFDHLFGDIGSGEMDYQAVLRWQDRCSSGISSSLNVETHPLDVDRFSVQWSISVCGLLDRLDDCTDMVWQYMHALRFDEPMRIKECLEKYFAYAEDDLSYHGHSYAMSMASAMISPKASIRDTFSGGASLQIVQYWVKQGQWDQLAEALAKLWRKLIKMPQAFSFIAPESSIEQGIASIQRVIGQQQQKMYHEDVFDAHYTVPDHSTQNAFLINADVNFVARCLKTVPYTHPDAATLSVLGKCMTNQYMHRVIREQGGAYGGGASHSNISGEFYFYSYRDPHHKQTLKAFDNSIDWGLQAEFSASMFDEAKISLIAQIDKPRSPYAQACRNIWQHRFGYTRDLIDGFRQKLVDVDQNALRRVIEAYLRNQGSDMVLVKQSDSANFSDAKLLIDKS